MKTPIIRTEQYTLRPFQESDAKLWQIWDVDTEVQAFMPEPPNEVQGISKQYEYIKECEEDEEGLYWSIETNSGDTIGTVSLTEINDYHKLADLGIVIGDKSYWGKGVASEVIKTLVEYAFENLDIIRINAETEADNVVISKVLEKVGFKQDGLFQSARIKSGMRIDVKHYGIVKDTI